MYCARNLFSAFLLAEIFRFSADFKNLKIMIMWNITFALTLKQPSDGKIEEKNAASRFPVRWQTISQNWAEAKGEID